MDAMIPNRFQILSLDGGGIKGLFSAAVLAKIEEDLSVRVTDHFDLITGTSIGTAATADTLHAVAARSRSFS